MKKPRAYTDELIRDLVTAVADGGPVRRDLPGQGRLYVDRHVPFLCVYRRPVEGWDDGTDRLVTSTAAFLIGSDERTLRKGQAALVRGIVDALKERFGALLLVEVWSGPGGDEGKGLPAVRIFHSSVEESERFVEVAREALAKDKRLRSQWEVTVTTRARKRPDQPPPILSRAEAQALGCTRLGLEVPPLFRDDAARRLFPVVLRTMRRVVDVALRKTVFEFARVRAVRKPRDYRSLGRKAVSREVWQADAQLAEVGRSYDFLLAMTPTNTEGAWRSFRRARFERAPELRYRPLTVDVSRAKRRLFSIAIERIEDPTMADLLREKQFELDRQLTILAERGSRRVLYGSLQLYGAVEPDLLREAEVVIELIPPSAREGGDGRPVSAEDFAARAAVEIASFSGRVDTGAVGVELREDVAAGLMVSQGRLLVAAGSRFPRSRIDALIQHEVGTHVLTYLNGRAQRLQQLAVGLAGYNGTQEGLAVLAEHLVGGLSRPRLRVLAGRVVAAHALVDGATFIEAFRLLLRYGFSQLTAFQITLRAFRGGGLTKDAVYLRGLGRVLDYLARGEPLEPLYVGKIGLHHTGMVRELLSRGVLVPAPLLPSHLERPESRERLSRLRAARRLPHQLAEPWDS